MVAHLAQVSPLPLPAPSLDPEPTQTQDLSSAEGPPTPSEAIDAAVRPFAASAELPSVLTIDELAAYLRVNHKTVRYAIARGEIPGVRRLGSTLRIHTATVLAWLARGHVGVSRSNRSR